MKVEVRRLGRIDFDPAWDLQRRLALEVTPERGFLLLLEHSPVFTLGKNGNAANLLSPGDIPVRRIDRGGDVTYHGPGQLVGYPLLDVRRLGIRRLVESLEASIVDLLAALGVPAAPRPGCVGVWASRGKIASLGIRVGSDLAPFSRINPCGVPGCAMSSVSLELGREVPVEEAAGRFRLRFAGGMLTS
jgi:lipoyl(octanoyl) transferase